MFRGGTTWDSRADRYVQTISLADPESYNIAGFDDILCEEHHEVADNDGGETAVNNVSM